MNKACARPDCGKTVYPLEELKCLDKVWHKQCFKCAVCGMVLSMKNYKGYEKIPYCEAHYPKTKATVCVDTPELKRLAETTKNQSLVKYHEDFERSKGKKTEVCDDPETQRHLKNTQVISNASYHGESERKEHMEKVRPPIEEALVRRERAPSDGDGTNGWHHYPSAMSDGIAVSSSSPSPLSPGDCDSESSSSERKMTSGYSSGSSSVVHSLAQYHSEQAMQAARAVQNQPRQVGSIADYDPVNGHFSSAVTGRAQPAPASPSQISPNAASKGSALTYVPAQQQPQSRPSAAALSGPHSPQQQQSRTAASYSTPAGSATQAAHQLRGAPTSPPATGSKSGGGPPKFPTGPMFRALYDYSAGDVDEVSFKEGDFIVNCKNVDEGWMTGTVQRTGQWGMLPANYVEKAN